MHSDGSDRSVGPVDQFATHLTPSPSRFLHILAKRGEFAWLKSFMAGKRSTLPPPLFLAGSIGSAKSIGDLDPAFFGEPLLHYFRRHFGVELHAMADWSPR